MAEVVEEPPKVVEAEADEEEETKVDESSKVMLPQYGYIYIKLRLCEAPSNFNFFEVSMFMNQRVRMLKEKIIEHHGRVEDIVLYNNEPSKDELALLKRQEDCRIK